MSIDSGNLSPIQSKKSSIYKNINENEIEQIQTKRKRNTTTTGKRNEHETIRTRKRKTNINTKLMERRKRNRASQAARSNAVKQHEDEHNTQTITNKRNETKRTKLV